MKEFVLDAYAARSCPVKTQNSFHPRIKGTQAPIDEALQELFDGGIAFQDKVIHCIVTKFAGTIFDARQHSELPMPQREQLTLQAMSEGVELIIEGVLPAHYAGHRIGQADLWLRGDDQEDGRPGYYPVEVKHHRVQERRQTGRSGQLLPCSTLEKPRFNDAVGVVDLGFRVASREADLLQVSHFWRILQAHGCASGGTPRAAVIGTDNLADLGGHVLTWVDLSAKQLRTFSRTSSEGWRLRSPLERYDHEHNFRCRVARSAIAQTGAETDPPLLVTPIVIRECDHCWWWESCRPQLDDLDLSLRIDKSPLDVREISVLRSFGIKTVADLVGIDLDELLPRYLPEVRHRAGAEDRLRLAARRARLLANGIDLERTTSAPINLPEYEVEIDLDIETAATDRVYLWGFLVNDRRAKSSEYVSFSAFAELNDEGEWNLAKQAMQWLQSLVASRSSVAVYHYSDYETVRLRRLLDASKMTELVWALAWSRENFVDMFALMRQHFFGTHGLGLKTVAHEGAGFTWRDDDPGGLNSQRWFDEAVHAESEEAKQAARVRVLEYNEDDVRATAALRGWLRTLD